MADTPEEDGIIPAYAGSTRPARPSAPGRGSSPHTRGALTPASRCLGVLRIIPAYAGSTHRQRPAHAGNEDHPRIRGEHLSEALASMYSNGSSPHTRGAQAVLDEAYGSSGIIPAYAGSTPASPTPAPSRQDHPRIRGEHSWFSPSIRIFGWIIPAYAGSTSNRNPRKYQPPDHPRIRGEHAPPRGADVGPAGSSPHTRGAL